MAPTGSDRHVLDTTVLLTAGHEGGAYLAGFDVFATGRAVLTAVQAALATSTAPVCVVPMTLGRDPRLVADTARALRWVGAAEGAGRVALSAPFGTTDHLIGWLRAALLRSAGPGTAVLVTAAAANPFADAELFRVARLARQYGQQHQVEVAFAGGDPELAEGVRRCRLLGADRVVLVPAGFDRSGADTVTDAVDGGPLLSASAIRAVLRDRTRTALRLLANGDDGIHTGLHAEHGHGYAHSHTHDHSPGHGPGHAPETRASTEKGGRP